MSDFGTVRMAVQFTFEPQKTIAAICLLASKGLPELTKGKVDKLLFLADKLHLVQHGRPITGDWYAALPHGPVPSRADNLLDALESKNLSLFPEVISLAECIHLDRYYQYPRLVWKRDPAEQTLSESDIEALDAVIERFGRKSFTELRSLTHELPAYTKAWGNRGGAMSSAMSFEDFFEEDEHAVVGVCEEMIENDAIRRNFPEPVWD